MVPVYQSIQAHLLSGEAMLRRDRNRAYLMLLTSENLLRSHYLEAGLIRMNYKPENIHWGWDAPTSEIRGTVCGHWLSAAAHLYTDTKDEQLLAKANFIVREIARCQEANGGLWAFPIPEKYLYWLKNGRHPWAPQYVCHKNMMGLLDMYRFTGNQQALETVQKCADWFYTFTDDITREQMSDMMDREETGGIMEYWADLFAVTGNEKHLALMRRYERPRLAEPLLQGVDMLTNMHANATIPEIQGYARAYEVTGEPYYRSVVEAYWDMAVEKRGTFATGGQTSGEIWTPMGQLAARLGEKNQEHCTVYNMMRLSQYLFRWTGDGKYADYWEKNLYNGIFAQGYWEDDTAEMLGVPHKRETTTVAYYLPMIPGAVKRWGSKLDDFWCCHCTLLQANAVHHESIYFQAKNSIIVAQYLPSAADMEIDGAPVRISQTEDRRTGGDMMTDAPINREVLKRPSSLKMNIRISAGKPAEWALRLRSPGWRTGDMQVWVNGETVKPVPYAGGFVEISRVWHEDCVSVCIGKSLTCQPLPDDPNMVAFLDGPICLAGIVGEEHLLFGDILHPKGTLLCPDDERHWQQWRSGWKTYRQPFGIRFMPLYQIGHETYTIYFPVEKRDIH
jgi:uncharacterized protein